MKIFEHFSADQFKDFSESVPKSENIYIDMCLQERSKRKSVKRTKYSWNAILGKIDNI